MYTFWVCSKANNHNFSHNENQALPDFNYLFQIIFQFVIKKNGIEKKKL